MTTHRLIPGRYGYIHEGDCSGSLCRNCGCCLHCADDCPCVADNGRCYNDDCGCSL